MEDSQIITLKDVESPFISSGESRITLKGINLTINRGEIFAIVGRSGSGKSALLRTIGLLERPSTGVIAIDNKTMTVMESSDIAIARRSIGYISNKGLLLKSQTVADNVALPLKIQNYSEDQISHLVQQVLEKVELTTKTNAIVKDLTPLQKVKVELARSLVNSPNILLCDELFSNLDQKSTQQLTALLRNLNDQYEITIILITNDSEVIKSLCKRVAIMQGGKIVEHATTLDLFTDPQSEVAKDFLRVTTRHELPWSYRRKLKGRPTENCFALIRVSFNQSISPEELLSKILQENLVKLNIIQAYQETITGTVINIMIIELYGDVENIIQASEFLRNHELPNEIIGYVTLTS